MEFRACVVCDEKRVLQVSFCLIFEGQQRKLFFRAKGLIYFVFCRLYPFSPVTMAEPEFLKFKKLRKRSKESIPPAYVA
jgi:hypothetical protein